MFLEGGNMFKCGSNFLQLMIYMEVLSLTHCYSRLSHFVPMGDKPRHGQKQTAERRKTFVESLPSVRRKKKLKVSLKRHDCSQLFT